MDKLYDTIIIGAGPAGLTAFLYSLLYGMSSVCIGDLVGGKVNIAPHIVDYPGIMGIAGRDFITNLVQQLKDIQAAPELGEVNQIEKREISGSVTFLVKTISGTQHETRSIILATGNGNKTATNRGVKLANQIGALTDRGFIKIVSPHMTSVTGVFAAGDCMPYPHSMEQLTTAVSTGIKAAAVAYEYLNKQKAPIVWGSAKIPRFT